MTSEDQQPDERQQTTGRTETVGKGDQQGYTGDGEESRGPKAASGAAVSAVALRAKRVNGGMG